VIIEHERIVGALRSSHVRSLRLPKREPSETPCLELHPFQGNSAHVQSVPEATRRETDRALVVLVARGQKHALAELYARHAPRMLALARRLLRDEKESEDLMHEVFLEIWRRAGEYDPERATVEGWMLMLTRSRSLDKLRSAHTRRSVLVGVPKEPEALGAELNSPDYLRVQRALEALAIEQRQVVILTYFDGLTSSEIAEVLNLPVGTVKSRTRLALERLRQELGVAKEARHHERF
jgi:RNA polymerase sigma-70 factor, ECF subfamily